MTGTNHDVACPKHMTFGPCGGPRNNGDCEMQAQPCPFAQLTVPVPWTTDAPVSPPRPAPASQLGHDLAAGRAVLTDLNLPPYDADTVTAMTRVLAESCTAFLIGEHQHSPDFPPTMMTRLVREAGGVPWVTLACRDRNRVALEQELAGLGPAGADGVLCVTGDGRAPGMRDATQVFDLDGTRLAALASAFGHAVAVAESPEAFPRSIRPARLVVKQQAGAHVAILNHVGDPAAVAAFVSSARQAGLTIPVIAAVAVYTDETSARGLQAFPGLGIDDDRIEVVLGAPDVRAAGIRAAVQEAEELLSIEGVAGVNLSGRGTSLSEMYGAEIKAEIGHRIREAT